MTLTEIVDILLTVGIVSICAVSAYTMTNKDIYEKTAFLIAEAAKLDLIGSEKMSRVVDKLYSYVPVAFRAILTKDKLQNIAQGIYDEMKRFAQLDNKEKKK